jgi:hypothetical protein
MPTDDFTGANGTPLTTYSANWSLNAGDFEIQSNGVRANSPGGECAARYTGSFANDQFASITAIMFGGSAHIGPAVRCATGGAATYYGYYVAASYRYIFKNIAGTSTILSSGSWTTADNDTHDLRLEANGTTITAILDSSADLGAQTDSAIASGSVGISGFDSGAGVRGDNWGGGDISAPPADSGSAFSRMQFIPHSVYGRRFGGF